MMKMKNYLKMNKKVRRRKELIQNNKRKKEISPIRTKGQLNKYQNKGLINNWFLTNRSFRISRNTQ